MDDDTITWLLYQELDRQLREAAQRRLTHPIHIRTSTDNGRPAAPAATETQRRDGVDD